MNLSKHIAVIVLSGWLSWVGADPAPFGLEIGKSTWKEAEQRYRIERKGINKYTLGPVFKMPPDQVHFEGLRDITLIYWPDGRLAGVLLTMGKFRFDEVVDMLAEKYQLVSRQRPFVGNASAEFRDGDTKIVVDAPHLSFDMTVVYLSKALDRRFKETERQEQILKKTKESEQL